MTDYRDNFAGCWHRFPGNFSGSAPVRNFSVGEWGPGKRRSGPRVFFIMGGGRGFGDWEVEGKGRQVLMIGRTDQVFYGTGGRGRGATSDPRGSQVAPTNVYDRSDRPISEYGRGDPPVTSEDPCETQVAKLERDRQPRPILKLIGLIIFSAVREAGGEGLPVFLEVGVTPRFFSGIAGPGPGLFPESSARDAIFFYNPQPSIRTFFVIASLRLDVFLKRAGGIVRSTWALETDPEDGGCRPHTPTSEEFRRPRWDAPAADQLPKMNMQVIFPARAR